MNYDQIKQESLQKVIAEKGKEYYCHVQFVVRVGLELAEKHQVNKDLIEIACLLHDIGRDQEQEGEDHGDAGARIALDFLQDKGLSAEEVNLIVSCIKKHNKEEIDLNTEEKIVVTADCASKVLYHEAFVLMCKKPTYEERLEWCKKYLEKGYRKITFPEYKEEVKPIYERLSSIYDLVSAHQKI